MSNNFNDLEMRAKDIIKICQTMLADESCIDPNRFVVGVILREFTEILNSLISNKKLFLLHKNRPIGCLFTISDSADFDFNRQLVNKIEEFNKLCSLIDESYKIYKYN